VENGLIRVKFLTMLRNIVGENTVETEIESKETVSGLVESLCQRYGEKFSEAVLNEDGNLKEYVKVILNGKEVGSEARLKDGDTVLIFVPVAGG